MWGGASLLAGAHETAAVDDDNLLLPACPEAWKMVSPLARIARTARRYDSLVDGPTRMPVLRSVFRGKAPDERSRPIQDLTLPGRRFSLECRDFSNPGQPPHSSLRGPFPRWSAIC